MELVFLGTSAGVPTAQRNVSALALRDGPSWDLFDCGEGTQHRLAASSLSLARLRRVFVSHLHGDHCFGLPGLLTSRAMVGATTPLAMFGPEGLERFVRTALEVSSSHLTFPLEFHTVDEAGGPVVSDAAARVDAVPLVHRVVSFAWSIREAERRGEFLPEKAKALGVPVGPAYGQLQRGESVTLIDGTVVRPDHVTGPARPGRHVVIAGDNSDPMRLVRVTGAAQVLVHEATFTEPVLTRLGDDRGHSTAARVATAAEAAGVGSLVLTHFSARYGEVRTPGATSIADLRAEAAAHFSGTLFLAHDFARFLVSPDGMVSESTDDARR
jgi:ribonuclease Z